jgi:Kef-type K+ transport system membrane component KefB
MNKNLLFYVLVLLVFGAGIYFILESGSRLRSTETISAERSEIPSIVPPSSQPSENSRVSSNSIAGFLLDNLRNPLSILLLQIIVIVITAKIIGRLFLKIGQPAVVGEMVAGILLGPSVLGLVSPATLTFLFPAASMGGLRLLSQIGVILFMFVVGMEVNAHRLSKKVHAAVIVSHASIILPFFLGVTLSLTIYRSLAPSNISFTAFALFMGTAMSITAFPVLARIIEERGMSKSYLGSLAIACAAVDDVTAWCILALVSAVVKADALGTAMLTILLALFFVGCMILLVKPQLSRIAGKEPEVKLYSKRFIAGLLAFVLASALFTEIIGIHALFGGFLAGIVMPSASGFRSHLGNRLEAFSLALLLPLFFSFTGLRTQINLIDDWRSWLACVGITTVAVAGKLGGSMLAARWTGISWRESFSLGALMNTRGLVELIVLNIGYDLGVLSGRIFAIMVLMALVTTLMTGPLLSLMKFGQQRESVPAHGLGSLD